MSMFPGPGAVIIYNEAGEPLGWDYPGEDDYNEPDPDDRGYPVKCRSCGKVLGLSAELEDEDFDNHNEVCDGDLEA